MATQEKRSRKMAGVQTPMCTALLIDGELVAGEGFVEPILNPATGEILTHIAEASTEQVEAAILAAHRAFAEWSRTTPQQRSNLLLDIANAVEKHADHLARLESLNCGKPLHLARHCRRVPLLRRRRALPDRSAQRRILAGLHQHGPSRSDWRGRLDCAVELPDHDGRVENRPGPRRR